MYGCKNRAPFAPSVSVQDGWETTWARRMVDMEFRMDPNCIYSTSELGEKDKACDGCRWKAGAGTEVAAGPVPVGDGVADLRQGESGPSGVGGPADVGRVADVAEQRRHLEQIWPGAAAYQPTEEKRMTDNELEAKLEAEERDAARYRWLRSRPTEVPTNGVDVAYWDDHAGESIRGDALDAAIDKEMGA